MNLAVSPTPGQKVVRHTVPQVDQIRSWRHSGFNVDRSVRLQAGDSSGIERLAQYMARSPFSLSRLLRITPDGKVLYKSDKDHCQRYPKPASEDPRGS